MSCAGAENLWYTYDSRTICRSLKSEVVDCDPTVKVWNRYAVQAKITSNILLDQRPSFHVRPGEETMKFGIGQLYMRDEVIKTGTIWVTF